MNGYRETCRTGGHCFLWLERFLSGAQRDPEFWASCCASKRPYVVVYSGAKGYSVVWDSTPSGNGLAWRGRRQLLSFFAGLDHRAGSVNVSFTQGHLRLVDATTARATAELLLKLMAEHAERDSRVPQPPPTFRRCPNHFTAADVRALTAAESG